MTRRCTKSASTTARSGRSRAAGRADPRACAPAPRCRRAQGSGGAAAPAGRLGGVVQSERRAIVRRVAIGIHRIGKPGMIGAETIAQHMQEGQPAVGIKRAPALENFAGIGDARGLALAGKQSACKDAPGCRPRPARRRERGSASSGRDRRWCSGDRRRRGCGPSILTTELEPRRQAREHAKSLRKISI